MGLDFHNCGDVSRGGLFVYTMKNSHAKSKMIVENFLGILLSLLHMDGWGVF